MEVIMKKLLLLTLLFTASVLKGVDQIPSLVDVTTKAMVRYDLEQFSKLDLKNKSLPQELKDKLKKELKPMLWEFSRAKGFFSKSNKIAISSDNSFIATGSNHDFGYAIFIFDAQTGGLLRKLVGHDSNINSIAISSDNSFAVTGSNDNTARVWDVQTGNLRHIQDHTNGVDSVAISPNNSFIVTSSHGRSYIWDAQTGKLRHTLWGQAGRIGALAISSNNNFIVGSSSDGASTVFIWDVQTGTLLHSIEPAGTVNSLAISSNNNFIVTGCYDGVHVWDVQTGTLLHTLCADYPQSVAISPDSNFIVAGFTYATRVWEAQTGTLLHTLNARNANSLAISSDNRFIVTCSDERVPFLYIWDMQTGALLDTLPGPNGPYIKIAISSNNNFIVAGSEWDTTAKIFSIEHLINMLSLEELMFIKALKNHAQKSPQGLVLDRKQAQLFYNLPNDVQDKLCTSCKVTIPWYSRTSSYVSAGIGWLKSHKLLATGAVAGILGAGYIIKKLYKNN